MISRAPITMLAAKNGLNDARMKKVVGYFLVCARQRVAKFFGLTFP